MKTYIPKQDEIDQKWYTVDVGGQVLGRAATQIARVLRGKNKPQFTPHLDVGDYIIVLNAREVVFTGRKETAKTYFHYSGYPGGAKFETVRKRRQRKPEEMVRDAVWGMLPKNRLGRHLLKKLHVYSGPEHPHSAQQPEVMTVG